VADPGWKAAGWIAGGMLLALPGLSLVIQALADVWRSPAVLPQQFGLRGFEIAFSSAGAAPAAIDSMLVASATTVLCLLLAWPAARALAGAGMARSPVVVLLIALPLLMPPYLAGFGLTEWFIRLGLDGTVTGLILAHTVLALPYTIIILTFGFGSRLNELEEMADLAGLSRVRRLVWVSLPSTRPALATAALLSFLVSWSQYGPSLAVGGGRSTLPIVMLPFIRTDPQVAAALGLVFIVPALIALAFAVRLQRDPL
jgi:putative spermidine/putrescine transport system permease protein